MDVNCLFEVAALESLIDARETMHDPIRQPHAQIIWVTHGSGYFSIDLERFRMVDNCIYTIPPGRYHQYLPNGTVSGYVLRFNSDFLNLAIDGSGRKFFREIMADLQRANMFTLPPNNTALETLFAEISREYEAQLVLRQEILSGLFRTFLAQMKRLTTTICQEEASSQRMRLFRTFCEKVDKQFKTMKQVADYAIELSVTPSYLTDVVKKISGYSASYYIQQRTVQEAKRLALYNGASLKMVAYELGFDDPSHFSKFFKNVAGLNYSDFKKRNVA